MEEIQTNESRLNEIIQRFFDKKNIADSCKKEAENYNKEIKELLQQMNETEFETDNGLIAKMTISERESFNEPSLIQKLSEIDATEAIDLVPTINWDKIEDMIYNGKLDASILTPYKEVKEVVTLKVSKKKGE